MRAARVYAPDGGSTRRWPGLRAGTGHYLHTYLVDYREISLAASPAFRDRYHLRGQDEDRIRALFVPELIRFLETHPDFYVEVSANAILAFRAEKDSSRRPRSRCCRRLQIS